VNENKLPLIIGFCGKAGSGKDAAGAILAEAHGYERQALADAVRHEILGLAELGRFWPINIPIGIMGDFGYDLKGWEITTEARYAIFAELFSKPTTQRMRVLLQWWGTEYRRSEDLAYWLKRMRFQPGKRYYVPDVRFANEAAFIQALGGVTLRVVGREQEGVPAHSSEALSWAGDLPTIHNDGTMNDLRQCVDHAVMGLCKSNWLQPEIG